MYFACVPVFGEISMRCFSIINHLSEYVAPRVRILAVCLRVIPGQIGRVVLHAVDLQLNEVNPAGGLVAIRRQLEAAQIGAQRTRLVGQDEPFGESQHDILAESPVHLNRDAPFADFERRVRFQLPNIFEVFVVEDHECVPAQHTARNTSTAVISFDSIPSPLFLQHRIFTSC